MDSEIQLMITFSHLYQCNVLYCYIESAVGDDGVCRLRHVGGVNKVVIGVAMLAVALLHHCQEVLQRQRVYLHVHITAALNVDKIEEDERDIVIAILSVCLSVTMRCSVRTAMNIT